jgi:5-methyltetrahydropteroyltriglutamate--homocysteine methyltransferase
MERSTERILTTHVGSLARPPQLLDQLAEKAAGNPYDERSYANIVRTAVADVVRRQLECGIDVVTDGEQSKIGFSNYLRERLSGLSPDEQPPPPPAPGTAPLGTLGSAYSREVEAFPEYYKRYFGSGNMSGVARAGRLVCTGPVAYRGQEQLAADLENLKQAIAAGPHPPTEAFVPATTGRVAARNAYYPSEDAFAEAVSEAIRTEYQAIVEAGFLLQVDDPGITRLWGAADDLPSRERRKLAESRVEAINHSLRGIPADRVRFHCCYGINEGPRVFDEPLSNYVELMFKINAGAYSFESANPRHAWSWRVFEDVKLPDGKILIPGCISHAHNIVEHPEYIAQLLVNYAQLVGSENVMAGGDCGFSSQATYTPEVDPSVVWAKMSALAEGARLATDRLFGPGRR